MRGRWNSAIASGSRRVSSVAKVEIVSGTQNTPIPTPCNIEFSASVVMLTLRSRLISHQPDKTSKLNPKPMPMRGSSLPRNIVRKKPIVAPTPRAPRMPPMI